MQIDHLVYAAADLDEAVDDLGDRFGVRAASGGSHPGLGTRNALLALGSDTYLEVIAPDPGQPAPSMPRPFGIDDLLVSRLAGWALATDDIDRAVATARTRGYDAGDAIDMSRVAPTGATLRWRLTLNALGGGPVPFLISWGDTPHPARTAPAGLVLESFRIEHPEPTALHATLTALGAEVTVTAAVQPALVATIRGPNGVEELR